MFGNHMEDQAKYLDSLVLPKCISLHSINFDYMECGFSKAGMSSKDKRDKLSKEGSGRVGIFKSTGITHCYTLEANYNCGRRLNFLSEAVNTQTEETVPETPLTDNRDSRYC